MRTLFCVWALALVLLPATVLAAPVSIVSVNGQATISRAPDQAMLGLQIITNNDVAATATSQNNATYNALRTRLAALGVSESAIHTRSFNVNFIPKPSEATAYRPPRTGYVVTRTLDVTLNDLGTVGKVIDAAVATGVSDIGGVSYGLRDRRAAYAAALAAAMHDAEIQATALAQAAHMQLGTIRSINAGGFAPPPPMPMLARAAGAAPNVPTEIQPTDVDVHASVSVTYNLK